MFLTSPLIEQAITPTTARRPQPPDQMLSRKELAELQSRLPMMGTSILQDFHRSAHFVCRIGPGALPQREGGSGVGRRLEAAQEMAASVIQISRRIWYTQPDVNWGRS
jgi:hypothetical protein